MERRVTVGSTQPESTSLWYLIVRYLTKELLFVSLCVATVSLPYHHLPALGFYGRMSVVTPRRPDILLTNGASILHRGYLFSGHAWENLRAADFSNSR
eukprot:COSAG02_NODE_4652_length_5132_cov_2.838069_5_plen_98_part_00